MPRLGSRVRVSFPAPDCQPRDDRGFLFKARWQSGYAADCNSVYAGSIPTRASIFTSLSIVRILAYAQYAGSRWCCPPGPGGEIGRRMGLKIPCPSGRAGSSPAPGTNSLPPVFFCHLLFLTLAPEPAIGSILPNKLPCAWLRLHPASVTMARQQSNTSTASFHAVGGYEQGASWLTTRARLPPMPASFCG